MNTEANHTGNHSPEPVRDALTLAADAIARLPDRYKEASDREDMLLMLRGEETGRDGYILTKALGYAIATLDGMPEDQRRPFEAEARESMVSLLRDMAWRDTRILADVAYGVKAHLGRAPDLGPEVAALVEQQWNEHETMIALDAIRNGAPLN